MKVQLIFNYENYNQLHIFIKVKQIKENIKVAKKLDTV